MRTGSAPRHRRATPGHPHRRRVTMRGMLYNVSGRDAVEIRLDTGRRFRLGTDDPDGLVAALRAHMRARHSA